MTTTHLIDDIGEYTIEEAEKQAKAIGKQGYFKALVGRNRIRVMPGPKGSLSPIVLAKLHRVEVPGEKWAVRFRCIDSNCPACQRSIELSRTGLSDDFDEAKKWQPRVRGFANIIDRKEPDKGPLIWEFGNTIIEQLARLRQNEDVAGDYSHPVKGIDLSLERKGSGQFDTEYFIQAVKQGSPLHQSVEQMNEWLEARHDLEACAPLFTAEEIAARLSGQRGGGRRMNGAQRGPSLPPPASPKRASRIEDDADME